VTRRDHHGGDIYAAARELSRSPSRLIDFSASINPLGPSKRTLRAAAGALPFACHYPDATCHDLVTTLASRWKLDPAHVVIGNGSSELIHLLPRALAIRHALILGPTFSEYERAVTNAGGRVAYLHARREHQYRPPVEEAHKVIRTTRNRYDALFLCNPNSPTGQAIPSPEVLELAAIAARRGLWVVVDETFVEYCEAYSVLPMITRHPRLLVLRSFTKFYGLPGMRIGYLVAAPDLAARVRHGQPPWSVNSLAQTVALAALKDRRHAQRSLAFVQRERVHLTKALTSIPGMVVFPTAANFLLVELPVPLDASSVTQGLRRRGMLVRDCSSVRGLNRRTIRIAVRTISQNRRLIVALRQNVMVH
jgi:threonine-phosphate decarboxylase